MTLTDENRANLEKLATYLESLPDDYDRFDMRTFFSASSVDAERKYALHNGGVPCGAVACALGHGPSAGVLMPKEMIEEGIIPNWNVYASLFVPKVATPEYFWCFFDDWEWVDDTPRGAAARIRYMLINGKPPRGFKQHPCKRHVRIYAPFLASADTHPKGGDRRAPFMSGAVPPEEAADAQNLPARTPNK